jgi:drug/metabolite transporter (DMT)-like permease
MPKPLPLALAGTAFISSSAVVMQLGGASASLTAFARCAIALPVLGGLMFLERRHPIRGYSPGPLTSRGRWLARISGVFLAADLIVWSHAIAAIGAGLGTVIPNLQVLFIALLGWLVLGERPNRSLLFAAPVMLAGLVLVGGLTGAHVYGADPAAGVTEGAAVAVLYSLYIFILRQATASAGQPSPVAVLFEATLGAGVTSAVLGVVLRDFRLPADVWPALGWLIMLALTSQVLGWLLITVSMSRLPAWMVGVVLLVQPVGSVALGYLVLSERPAWIQLAGMGLMLAGVLIVVRGRAARGPAEHEDHAPGAGGIEGDVAIKVTIASGDGEAAGKPDGGIHLSSGPEPVRHHVGDGPGQAV